MSDTIRELVKEQGKAYRDNEEALRERKFARDVDYVDVDKLLEQSKKDNYGENKTA